MQNSFPIGKTLILAGILLVMGGMFVLYGKYIPWINKLGKLPGDIQIQKEGFSFYFPLTTCILISAAMTLLSLMIRWLSK